MKREREIWIDDVKVVACMLVLLGHLMMAMVEANVVSDGAVSQWLIKTIYYFHVPLFFICSGYLYQKLSIINTIESWGKNVLKKLITLGIPYFTFTTATWVIKLIFSGAGNNEIDNIFVTLFLEPTSPYWYLYALFFVFLITPTFESKKISIVGLAIALLMKIVYLAGAISELCGGVLRTWSQRFLQTRYGLSSECACARLKSERFALKRLQLVLCFA
ncbi:MAG: acyltransferase [Oscillospiraceae bacterium]|nr:acyltransferase [Oscillospiraceae bacterium]